jgi:hypothetical protein
MTNRRVRVARRETYAGEFANIEVDVELTVGPEESTQHALERAAQEVASRLEFERRRRRSRGAFWADTVVTTPPLETYGDSPA